MVKYLGGKQRIGKHIAEELKKHINDNTTYLEPFVGGCGVLKNMTTIDQIKEIKANDYHPDLIQMWKEVQKGKLKYPESISEEEYIQAKELKSPNALKAFIGFGMSFGGRYFGAYSQKYLGNKKEDFCKEMRHSLERIGPLIKKVKFTNKEYQTLKPEGYLIYCDPPYANTKYPIKYRRGIKEYDTFNTEEFWNIMREWSKNNTVIISELSAPSDFKEIWSSELIRSASHSKNTKKKNVVLEKLFMYNV
jgi:DNA adenine methylase